MKKVIFALSLLSSVSAAAETHYSARNCEIFVDKVAVSFGSHASRSLTLYVKTLNSRLDGPLAEVGFRNILSSVPTYNHGSSETSTWSNTIMHPFMDAKDYFVLPLGSLASDFGSISYKGALYVKTSRDTYYWLKPNQGDDNFVFGPSLWDQVASVVGPANSYWNYSSDLGHAVATQRDGMQYLNPDRCY